jgi:hypothetical protein
LSFLKIYKKKSLMGKGGAKEGVRPGEAKKETKKKAKQVKLSRARQGFCYEAGSRECLNLGTHW